MEGGNSLDVTLGEGILFSPWGLRVIMLWQLHCGDCNGKVNLLQKYGLSSGLCCLAARQMLSINFIGVSYLVFLSFLFFKLTLGPVFTDHIFSIMTTLNLKHQHHLWTFSSQQELHYLHMNLNEPNLNKVDGWQVEGNWAETMLLRRPCGLGLRNGKTSSVSQNEAHVHSRTIMKNIQAFSRCHLFHCHDHLSKKKGPVTRTAD